jgi:hypothetical protein
VSSQGRKTKIKTLRGTAPQTPRQGNDSPAPRNKGAGIFGFSGSMGFLMCQLYGTMIEGGTLVKYVGIFEPESLQ